MEAEAIIADLRAGGEDGLIYDAVWEPEFSWAILQMLSRRRPLPGRRGRLSGVPALASLGTGADHRRYATGSHRRRAVEQLGRLRGPGHREVHPPVRWSRVELGRFLGERAHFANAPATAGSIEYRSEVPGSAPVTVAALEEFVPNEGSGYNYVVDALGHGLEEALANPGSEDLHLIAPPRLLDVGAIKLEPGNLLVGPHLEWASLLGARTAELHLALTSDPADPDLAPEPMTGIERQALYHGARSLTKRVFRQLASIADPSECLQEVLAREAEVAQRLGVMSSVRASRPADPVPRGLPPGPAAVDGQGLRHHRLRGGAQPIAEPAPAEAPRSGGRGRDDPVVPLRLAGRSHPPQPRSQYVVALGPRGVVDLWYPLGGRAPLLGCLPQVARPGGVPPVGS